MTGRASFGIEQLRLLLLPLLILTVYFSNMTQTFALSHIIGLLASSFDLAKRDAMLVGLVGYALFNTLPLVGAALLYFPFRVFRLRAASAGAYGGRGRRSAADCRRARVGDCGALVSAETADGFESNCGRRAGNNRCLGYYLKGNSLRA